MKPKNRYYNRSHISEKKFKDILLYFCEDLNATAASSLSGVSRNSVNKIYALLRERIAHESISNTPQLGEFEVDESYFGAKRVRGKRGRGAAGKTPVFGILKRGGNVYVNVVKHCSREQLMPIIQGKALEGSTIHSDGWRAYDGLILNGYTHYRVHHGKNEFVRGKSHVNGIESFWSYAKRRLSKLNGVHSNYFHLHLKECEWRWNHHDENIYAILLPLLRKNPL